MKTKSKNKIRMAVRSQVFPKLLSYELFLCLSSEYREPYLGNFVDATFVNFIVNFKLLNNTHGHIFLRPIMVEEKT